MYSSDKKILSVVTEETTNMKQPKTSPQTVPVSSLPGLGTKRERMWKVDLGKRGIRYLFSNRVHYSIPTLLNPTQSGHKL